MIDDVKETLFLSCAGCFLYARCCGTLFKRIFTSWYDNCLSINEHGFLWPYIHTISLLIKPAVPLFCVFLFVCAIAWFGCLLIRRLLTKMYNILMLMLLMCFHLQLAAFFANKTNAPQNNLLMLFYMFG